MSTTAPTETELRHHTSDTLFKARQATTELLGHLKVLGNSELIGTTPPRTGEYEHYEQLIAAASHSLLWVNTRFNEHRKLHAELLRSLSKDEHVIGFDLLVQADGPNYGAARQFIGRELYAIANFVSLDGLKAKVGHIGSDFVDVRWKLHVDPTDIEPLTPLRRSDLGTTRNRYVVQVKLSISHSAPTLKEALDTVMDEVRWTASSLHSSDQMEHDDGGKFAISCIWDAKHLPC